MSDPALISIHVPLAGHDDGYVLTSDFANIISIYMPLAGHDRYRVCEGAETQHFNPHAPCGARPSTPTTATSPTNFNPRAPCGARPSSGGCETSARDFNPRAPCGARHSWPLPIHVKRVDFNPRAPCGARPDQALLAGAQAQISIRVPLAGHDHRGLIKIRRAKKYFNPRAPCGARPSLSASEACAFWISIHVPLAGHDDDSYYEDEADEFQSTCPLRGTTSRCRRSQT